MIIALISILSLLLLFFLAYLAERRKYQNRSLINNPIVYSLSLAIYCSAWTFYGNVSSVTDTGILFLAIYIGPTLVMLLGLTVLKKMVRISNVLSITSIADFVSARYGKNRSLGIVVTILSLFAGIPYIGLQIKAIASSLQPFTRNASAGDFYQDQAFYICILIVVFTILFGTRKILPNERHEGMVFAVAAESIFKLLAFLLVGFSVTYLWHNGFNDIFSKYYFTEKIQTAFDFEKSTGYGNWSVYILISGLAFVLLPRQFHVAVVENKSEENLKQAAWMFPLYLFLIVLFVIPLALTGNGLISGTNGYENAIINLPLHFSSETLAAVAYLGGFLAATGMIIVECIAISTMVTNSLLLPLLLENIRFKNFFRLRILQLSVWLRRLTILLVVSLAYLYYKGVSHELSLISLGLIAFVAVIQLAPAVLGGMYNKGLTRKGILCGILTGTTVWFLGLIIPSLIPYDLTNFYSYFSGFRIESLDFIANIGFWSLLLNILAVLLISSITDSSALETKQAILFVDVFNYSNPEGQSVFWKGTAKIKNMETLLAGFLGRKRSAQVLRSFAKRHHLNLSSEQADPLLVSYVENTISQYVGTGTANMLVSSISKEEVVTVEEVLEVFKRSQQVVEDNAELRFQKVQYQKLSDELSLTNQKLKELDAQKDDFIRTVTHEFRTPLTAIKALAELVHDHPDMEEREEFLKTIVQETDRLGRLVNEVLELEKYASGKQKLKGKSMPLHTLAETVRIRLLSLTDEKDIKLHFKTEEGTVFGDEDKLIQMLINLISNSIKFVSENGNVWIRMENTLESTIFEIEDDGIGIPQRHLEKVFDKFYQIENKNSKGTGLGLSIVKNIVELHDGQISINSKEGEGTLVRINFPIKNK
jgi:Na+/proline symporter/nitrogen-specific signal transduction histidine kinase